MSELPDRDTIIADLGRLTAAGEASDDRTSRYVGSECRVALYALRNGHEAEVRDEFVGALYYLRLVIETAIRVAWIAGDELRAGPFGRPNVEGQAALLRARRLERRDLMQLASAYEAIARVQPPETGRIDLIAQLRAMVDAIEERAAPAQIEQLATSAIGRNLYAGHRVCSAQLHPGAWLGRDQTAERPRVLDSLDGSAYVCGAFADACLRAWGTI